MTDEEKINTESEMPQPRGEKSSLDATSQAPIPVEAESTETQNATSVAQEAKTTRWYVIRVQAGREEQIKEGLERRIMAIGMNSKIPRVVIPTEKVTEIRGGKKSVRDKKLYPGYMMVEMELNDETWFTVRETPGIGDFLGLKKPVPMEQYEVDKILFNIASSEEKPKIKIDVKKGDSVRIKEGPFENFDGHVEEVNTEKGVVNVTIIIFGRPTKVDLEYWQLEKV